MNLLKIENLAIEYKGRYLFDNLNIGVETGERLVIIGFSGCGKSSILKAILGAIAYSGDIKVNSKISYMPQTLALLDHKTVRQNVELPAVIDNAVTAPQEQDYALFGLKPHVDKYVSKLSGGERQRVALMRALYSGGDLLLFDEPLSKLDQINKEKMISYFLEHITSKFGLVYITHDLLEAVKVATKILVLSENPQIIENNLQQEEMVKMLASMLANNK